MFLEARRRAPEPWACLFSQKVRGLFSHWRLSSCLQVVLCALLAHNSLAGWCGKEGTIKWDEYERAPLPSLAARSQAPSWTWWTIIAFFFSSSPLCYQQADGLMRYPLGCQGGRRDGWGQRLTRSSPINQNLSISFHLTAFKHWAFSHTVAMWAEWSGTLTGLSLDAEQCKLENANMLWSWRDERRLHKQKHALAQFPLYMA